MLKSRHLSGALPPRKKLSGRRFFVAPLEKTCKNCSSAGLLCKKSGSTRTKVEREPFHESDIEEERQKSFENDLVKKAIPACLISLESWSSRDHDFVHCATSSCTMRKCASKVSWQLRFLVPRHNARAGQRSPNCHR